MMVTRVVSRWATRPKQGNFDGVARSLNAHLGSVVAAPLPGPATPNTKYNMRQIQIPVTYRTFRNV